MYRWFMPLNIAFTFLFGGLLGWIVIKLLKPKPYLEGLVMAVSSTGCYVFICLLSLSCFGANLANVFYILISSLIRELGVPSSHHYSCNLLWKWKPFWQPQYLCFSWTLLCILFHGGNSFSSFADIIQI